MPCLVWDWVWVECGVLKDEDRDPPVLFYLGVYYTLSRRNQLGNFHFSSFHPTTTTTNIYSILILDVFGYWVEITGVGSWFPTNTPSSSLPLSAFPPYPPTPPPHQMMIASIESQYKPWVERELMRTEISHYTGRCQLLLCLHAKT